MRSVQLIALVCLGFVCTGCATGGTFRGHDLPATTHLEIPPSGLDVTLSVGAANPEEAPALIWGYDESFIRAVFRKSGVFENVEIDDGTSSPCHIQVLDHTWPRQRTFWSYANITPVLSFLTLGIVPGYSTVRTDYEFVVTTARGETRYRYADHIWRGWGWWFLPFSDDEFLWFPGLEMPHPGESQRIDQMPRDNRDAMEMNIIWHFLADFSRDYGPPNRP